MGLIVDVSGARITFPNSTNTTSKYFLRKCSVRRIEYFLVTFANHIRLVSDFSPSGPEIIERMKEYQKRDKGKGKNKRAGVL